MSCATFTRLCAAQQMNITADANQKVVPAVNDRFPQLVADEPRIRAEQRILLNFCR